MRQPLMVLLLLVGLACGITAAYDLSQSDPLSTVEALIALVGFVVAIGAGYVGASVAELMQRVAPQPVPQPMPYAAPQQGQATP